MVVGINFPAGGFRVTPDLQVVDVYGDPVPGLYAVGDCVGGIAPAIGLGGLKITPAVTLGRVAGRVAASGVSAPATPKGAALFADVGASSDAERMRVAIVDR
jgi:succinate dehydrogenase/fumarate reductase flavoprotein subunit